MENRYDCLKGKSFKNPDDGKIYTIESISDDGTDVKLSQPITTIGISTILGRWQEVDSMLQTESLICG
jgi:hypothetical protein